MLFLFVIVQSTLARLVSTSQPRLRRDAGQTTAEYALVLVAAGALVLVVIMWISKTDKVGQLFDFVLDKIRGNAG